MSIQAQGKGVKPPTFTTPNWEARRKVGRRLRELGRFLEPAPKVQTLPPFYGFMVAELAREFAGLSAYLQMRHRAECAQISRVLDLARQAVCDDAEGSRPFRPPSLCQIEEALERARTLKAEWESRGDEDDEADEASDEGDGPISDPWQFAVMMLTA